ncbi:MAG: TIGR04283 family arsenosugar biosynthesis glycosyltransferase [Hyphomonadaceae bacterium]|nr:MAG: family 2 glycosyl transferase [Caulobacteraceae bacterium]MBT9447316.1 TIGR04283 family arsenosugar biosynthesis glycosyltransferase [Hyphomonadaceae bacterium]TPW08273.1 MAG: family 2 glycosyl transferase [Alphaproteobacteria bacterium]
MPTLNAAPYLARSLAPLVRPVMDGRVREVIISDGGSNDDTRAIADGVGATFVEGARGRGIQLIAGAAAARSPWLLFLHADTALDESWSEEAARFIARPDHHERAGVFRFAFDDEAPAAKRAEWWVGLRNNIFKLPYGDQGLLISRGFYDALGGYKALPLMEDVDFVRRIGGGRLALLRARAVTSADKYRRDGYGARARRNLWLLARYLMGADPADLAKSYD